MASGCCQEDETFIFTWKIENFSLCSHLNKDSLRSPNFIADAIRGTEWYLIMYLRGCKDLMKGIPLALHKVSDPHKPECRSMKYKFSVLLTSNNSGKEREVFSEEYIWNHPDFEDRKSYVPEIKSPGDVLVKQNILTLRCYMSSGIKIPLFQSNSSIDGKQLSSDLTSLYERGDFADYTLRLEKSDFKVHKCILYARSRAFAEELESRTSQSSYISEMDSQTLRKFLLYIYSGKLDASNFSNNLQLAVKKFGLDRLKTNLYTSPNELCGRTVIKAQKKSLLWSIKQFNAIQPGEKLYSSAFSTNTCDWKIMLSISRDSDKEESVDLSVFSSSFNGKNGLNCRISIRDVHGELRCPKTASRTFNSNEILKFPKFTTKNILNCHKDLYLFNNILTLHFYFAVAEGQEQSYIEETSYALHTLEDVDDSKGLCEDMRDLYIKQKFCDAILTVDGKKHFVHKAILCARSHFFDRILKSQWGKGDMLVHNMYGLDDTTVELLILYMYSGSVSFSSYERTAKLYSAAAKYQIMSLKNSCSTYLKSIIHSGNAADILAVAETHQDVSLKVYAQDYIFSNADRVLETRKWRKLIDERPQLANEILRRLSSELRIATKKRKSSFKY